MNLNVNFDVKKEYLHCSVSGVFEFEEAIAVFKTMLYASLNSNRESILMDFSGIKQPVPAIEKLLAAYGVKEEFDKITFNFNISPKIAIFGVPPFLSTYRPGDEYFKSNKMPIKVFADFNEACEWLKS